MEHNSLTEALAAFQSAVPKIVKGNTAKVPTKNGGEFKYSYADLTDVTEIILPKLSEHGLAWTAAPTMSEFGFALHYQLRHSGGEVVEGFYPLPQAAPQEIGSAVTYARRYALCAVTGVAPGGDDDDAASTKAAPQNVPAARNPRRDRAGDAIAAIEKSQDRARLAEVWAYAHKEGVAGIERVAAAHTKRYAELDGTREPDLAAEWGPAGTAS